MGILGPAANGIGTIRMVCEMIIKLHMCEFIFYYRFGQKKLVLEISKVSLRG